MHPRAIIFRARIRFINPVKFRLFERFCHRCNILIVCHIISPARRRNTRCRHIGKRLHTYQRHRQKCRREREMFFILIEIKDAQIQQQKHHCHIPDNRLKRIVRYQLFCQNHVANRGGRHPGKLPFGYFIQI